MAQLDIHAPVPQLPGMVTTALRNVSLVIIVLAPAWLSIRSVQMPESVARREGVPVTPGDGEAGIALAEYLADRDQRVGALLPDAGGGRFYVGGLDAYGKAFLAENLIVLNAHAPQEHVELHELAHLVQENLRAEVAAVLAHVGSPAPFSYANDGPGEHFAEMASEAWQVLVGIRGFCLAFDAPERLASAEAEVPGTAAFVAYFLRHRSFDDDPVADSIRPLVPRYLNEDARPAWDALWAALEDRRLPDGSLAPWPAPTALERHRRIWSRSETRGARVLLRILMTPSELVVRAITD